MIDNHIMAHVAGGRGVVNYMTSDRRRGTCTLELP